VWVGGLAEGTNWKALEKHFAAVKKPVVTEIMKKGTAVLAYDTVEDVELAIASFNGSDLDGQALEVDVWIQKPKREDAVPRQKVKKVMPVKVMPVRQVVIKTALKGKPTDEANRKMKEKLAAFDHALKVWVGGLPANTAWKALNEHLATVAKPKLTHVMNKGTACVVFESSDDVAIVIASLNASEFNGNTIELDVWTKPERKEKVAKVKAEVVADAVQPDAVGHAEVSPEMPSASAEGEAPPAESRRPAPLESPVPLRDAKRLAWQEVTSPASTAGVTSDTGGATTATATTASGSEGSSRGNGRQSPLRSGKLRPVSPRTRMGDVLAGQYSPTRYPESCGRPSRMIGVAGNWLPARPASAASFSFTASSRGSGPLRVSRSSPGSPRPGAREALAASNECVAWLKYRQSDAHVEGEIDKMI
ncbi:unnamed protein product, partial [Polarella glacialis]